VHRTATRWSQDGLFGANELGRCAVTTIHAELQAGAAGGGGQELVVRPVCPARELAPPPGPTWRKMERDDGAHDDEPDREDADPKFHLATGCAVAIAGAPSKVPFGVYFRRTPPGHGDDLVMQSDEFRASDGGGLEAGYDFPAQEATCARIRVDAVVTS